MSTDHDTKLNAVKAFCDIGFAVLRAEGSILGDEVIKHFGQSGQLDEAAILLVLKSIPRRDEWVFVSMKVCTSR